MSTDTTTEPEAPERDARAEMRAALLADGWTPERTRVRSEAFLELQQNHPRMFALVREQWDGDRLIQPYLLAVAPTRAELRQLTESLPANELVGAMIHYVLPAGAVLGY